ncbi:MAG: TIGR00282 family metallophosphoesterase [Armatimonadetes bacterium]|nr:TIGR00282 family metallophosphoesterase [Armatimonadota bacterium]MDW8121776.1 TIGR00282 family metallophosphoesterase [Armatimonadota bacterium]
MAEPVRILFVGDVVGRTGRHLLNTHLHRLKKELACDFAIVNGENAAGGLGITERTAQEIFEAGADCITTGNHIWHHKEAIALLSRENRILRPANFPPEVPGSGWGVYQTASRRLPIAVLNLMGQIFMNPILDSPFHTFDRIRTFLPESPIVTIVDFHAEATSEKQAFAYYVDGRVTAVIGTHTHVPTCDERILSKGTAFITDVGMTGALDSVIGMRVNEVLYQFLTKMPSKFEVASGPGILSAVLLRADPDTGEALSIERICVKEHSAPTENGA